MRLVLCMGMFTANHKLASACTHHWGDGIIIIVIHYHTYTHPNVIQTCTCTCTSYYYKRNIFTMFLKVTNCHLEI